MSTSPTTQSKKTLVTIGKASEILGVSIDTIRRWDKAGLIKAYREEEGKARRFSIEELRAMRASKPLTISEVASELNVSTSTLRRLEKRGALIPQRNSIGERVYSRDSVKAFIARSAQSREVEKPALDTNSSIVAPQEVKQPKSSEMLEAPVTVSVDNEVVNRANVNDQVAVPVQKETISPISAAQPVEASTMAVNAREETHEIDRVYEEGMRARRDGRALRGLRSQILTGVLSAGFTAMFVIMFLSLNGFMQIGRNNQIAKTTNVQNSAQNNGSVLGANTSNNFFENAAEYFTTLFSSFGGARTTSQRSIAQNTTNDNLSVSDVQAVVSNIEARENETIYFAIPATFLQDISAPNIVYRVTAGTGVTITGDPQNPVINATTAGTAGVSSFQGSTGAVSLVAGSGITIDGLTISSNVSSSTEQTFKTISVSGQSDVVADSSTDTLTLTAGTGITITTDANGDNITISSTGGSSSSGFTDNGTVISLTTSTDHVTLGSTTDLAKLGIDGQVDEIQLLVQGNGTQTASLIVAETSTGTDVFTVSNSGAVVQTGSLTISGVGTDITTGTGEDLTLVANGGGVINLNDTVVVTGTSDLQGSIANSTGVLTIADDVSVTGSTTLGDNSSDTVVINAGRSGVGISFAHASFANCSALETVGGVLTCGTDDTGGAGAWTDGSGYVYLTSSNNNVGIGTSAPAGKVQILGDADEIQLLVTGNATQTSNLLTLEQNGGTDVFTVTNAGNVAIAGTLNVTGNTILTSGTATNFSTTGNLTVAGNTITTGSTSTGYLSVSTNASISGSVTAGAIVIGGDTITEFAGTGLSVVGNALTTTLGTSIDNSELTNSSITFAGDLGTSTTTLGGTRTIAGGTNGIDTSDNNAGTLTINLDTTEIGSTTFGSGSALTWTFDASAGTDTTIAFGNNTITATAGTFTHTGGIAVSGVSNLQGSILNSTGAVTIADDFSATGTTFVVTSGTASFSGRLGIGTTAPTVALDVVGAGSFSTNLNVTGSVSTSTLNVSSNASINGNTTLGDNTSDTITFNAGISGTGISFASSTFGTCTALETVGGVLTCGSDDTGGGSLFTDSGAYTYLTSTTDELLIGTSTQMAGIKLTVSASGVAPLYVAETSGTVAVFRNSAGTGSGGIGIQGTSSGTAFIEFGDAESASAGFLGYHNVSESLYFGLDGAIRWRIDSNGHFVPEANDTYDIGTNTARIRDLYLGSDTLHIGTSTSDEYAISYNTSNNTLGFNVNGSGNPEIVMDSSGNVGIGTTAPTVALDVLGSGSYSGSLAVLGNTTLGDASNDTVTFNAGKSGSGITFADSTFFSCTALETSASGVLTCGTDDVGGGAGAFSNSSNLVYLTTTSNFLGIGTSASISDKVNIVAATSGSSTFDGLQIDFTQSSDSDSADTNAGLNINITSSSTAADTLLGINIESITAQNSVREYGLRIGSGWDSNIYFADTTTNISIADSGTFTFNDGTNTLFTIVDAGTRGNIIVSGDLTLSGSAAYISNSQTTFHGESFGAGALTSTDSVAIGYGAIATNNSAVAIGSGANASVISSGGIAIGNLATSTGGDSVIIGHSASGTSEGAISIGANSSAAYLSIALGYGASAPASETLNIGNTIYGDLATDKIGIGKVSPTVALDVVGSGSYSGALSVGTNFTVGGNTTLGDASNDTVTFNAGKSGSGITFADSTFFSCTALETSASGVLTCGTDDVGGGAGAFSNSSNLAYLTTTSNFLGIGISASISDKVNIVAATSGSSSLDGLQIDFTQSSDGDSADNNSGININLTQSSSNADILNGLSISIAGASTSATERGISIGTGFDDDIYFASSSATLRIQSGGQLAITDGFTGGGTSADLPLARLKEYFSDANFGVWEAGGFINLDGSYRMDNFINPGSASADISGASKLGDNQDWIVDEAATGAGGTNTQQVGCQVGVGGGNTNLTYGTSNQLNGVMYIKLDSNSVTNSPNTWCSVYHGDTAGSNATRMAQLNAANKFVMYYKVRPDTAYTQTNTPSNNNLFFWLGANQHTQGFFGKSTLTSNNNLIAFTNLDGTQTQTGTNATAGTVWNGWVQNGTAATNISTVACSGANISTATNAWALMRIEARATNDVHFFIDPDVSNGVGLSECGAGITSNIPTGMLRPMINVAQNGGTISVTRGLFVDLFAFVQDDVRDGKTQQQALTNDVETANTSSDIPDLVGGADLAENYYVPDGQEIHPGEIVSLGASAGQVDKSSRPYDRKLLGVVSEAPGLQLGVAAANTVPVALTGRVPVKVNTTGGAIKVGDSITPSTIAGEGMKATEAGKILGTAMEDFNGTGTGTIMVHVNVGYYLGEELGSEQNDQLGFGPSELASNSAQLANDPVIAVRSYIYKGLTEFWNKVTFKAEAEFWAEVAFKATVRFEGQVEFNKDTAGYATIKKGERFVDVAFDQAYRSEPIVNVSINVPQVTDQMYQELIASGECDAVEGKSACQDKIANLVLGEDLKEGITGKSIQGFMIMLNKPAPVDITYSWQAIAVKDAKTSVTKTTEDLIQEATGSAELNTGEVAGVATPSATISPTPTQLPDQLSPTPTAPVDP